LLKSHSAGYLKPLLMLRKPAFIIALVVALNVAVALAVPPLYTVGSRVQVQPVAVSVILCLLPPALTAYLFLRSPTYRTIAIVSLIPAAFWLWAALDIVRRAFPA
jgi:hypothetical protein